MEEALKIIFYNGEDYYYEHHGSVMTKKDLKDVLIQLPLFQWNVYLIQ